MRYLSQIERQIVERLVDDALAAGLVVSVYDGEEYAVKLSADRSAILKEIGETEETTLRFRDPLKLTAGNEALAVVGSVLLIVGNGCDILSDWSDNYRTNALLKGALSVAEGVI